MVRPPGIEIYPEDTPLATRDHVRPARSLGTPVVGRQAFEDAQFNAHTRTKLRILRAVMKQETKYDVYFSTVIVLNLVVIGVETDLSAGGFAGYGLSNPFYWIETIFLVIFILELGLRLQLHRRRTRAEAEAARRASSAFALGVAATSAPCPKTPGATVGLPGTSTEVLEPEERKDSDNEASGASRPQFVLKRSMKDPHSALLAAGQVPPLGARILVAGKSMFLRNFWLGLDILLVVVAALDVGVFTFLPGGGVDDAGPPRGVLGDVTVLRILRVLRVLRSVKLLRYFKELALLCHGLTCAFRTIFWIVLLLLILIYCCSIFLTRLVGQNPHMGDSATQHFGSVGSSMYTLFVVLTLESWPEISGDVMSGSGSSWIGWFFVIYILISHFAILNLVVGVICEQLQKVASTNDLALMQEVRGRRAEAQTTLQEVFRLADRNGDGTLTIREFRKVLAEGEAKKILAHLEISATETEWLFDVLDKDGDGRIDVGEFVSGLLNVKASEQSRQLMTVQHGLMKELRRARRDFHGGAGGGGCHCCCAEQQAFASRPGRGADLAGKAPGGAARILSGDPPGGGSPLGPQSTPSADSSSLSILASPTERGHSTPPAVEQPFLLTTAPSEQELLAGGGGGDHPQRGGPPWSAQECSGGSALLVRRLERVEARLARFEQSFDGRVTQAVLAGLVVAGMVPTNTCKTLAADGVAFPPVTSASISSGNATTLGIPNDTRLAPPSFGVRTVPRRGRFSVLGLKGGSCRGSRGSPRGLKKGATSASPLRALDAAGSPCAGERRRKQ